MENEIEVQVPSYELFVELKQKVERLEQELGSLRDTFNQYTDHRAKGGQ